METTVQASQQAEERLVAELAQLGVRYLSCQSSDPAPSRMEPHKLLAGLVSQPSSRVRSALIALLLAQPDYARYVPRALKGLSPKDAQTLRFFYTAAVHLQHRYSKKLRASLGKQWCRLPDLFSDELGVTGDTTDMRLRYLARLYAEWSGERLNWAGTYENAARHLIRSWEREQTWKA